VCACTQIGGLGSSDRLVVACSALKRRYRDVLRTASGVRFVFLEVHPDTAHERARHRVGHFMGAGMVSKLPLALFAEHSMAEILGLARRSSVAVYRSRYDDFPEPVIEPRQTAADALAARRHRGVAGWAGSER
jgi:hypothetical protein